jgi:hypothetical protein
MDNKLFYVFVKRSVFKSKPTTFALVKKRLLFMYKIRGYLLSLFLFIFVSGMAQKQFPADYFRPPLDIPMYLSGTFGELRSNHFHAGIDIKTQGVEGKNVFAVADGYVSRIKVSLWGYGNVIYITHPNGLISVYGHLQRFNKVINRFVRKGQYKRKSYVVELFPDKDELVVKKGDVIALSGNTGGSMGPHLHFEIRDAGNQHPLNPLLYKSIKIKDRTKPVIAELAVYPVGNSSVVNNGTDTLFLPVVRKGNTYSLKNDQAINVSGKIAFGLRAYDKMDEINNKNGIYEEKLYLDSVLVFDIQMKELSFYTTRYINSLIDYNYYQKKKRRLIRTELDTNNQLSIYRTIKNNGVFNFDDTLSHQLEYMVKDAYGNSSRFMFLVKGSNPGDVIVKSRKPSKEDSVVFVHFAKQAEINFNGFKMTFSANAFYRSQEVSYGKQAGSEENYADVYRIGSRFIPLQKRCSFSIKLNRTVVDSLYSKLYIAKVGKGGSLNYSGGVFEDGWMTGKSRSLGEFTVAIDTIPPAIKPVNVKDGKSVAKQRCLKFIIADKPTGIKNYAGFLNGKWVLMEYNPKKATLTYNFDWLLKKGKNNFKLVVIDNRDNKTVYEANLFY